MLCRNLIAASWVIFTAGTTSIHLVNVSTPMNKYLKPSGALGQDAHDVDSPYYKRSGDIDRSKGIDMLRHLLLKELAIPAFLYVFYYVILRCGSVKSMPECFFDDQAP
jgi:hypothetical protein